MPQSKLKYYRRRDPAELKRMIELYKGGLSMEETGEAFGISKQRVEQILKKEGVKTRGNTNTEKYAASKKSRRKILPKDLLIDLYVDKKLPVKEIALKLGVSEGSLYRNLSEYGIPRRETEPSFSSPLTAELLRKLYIDEKMTARQIAEKLDYAPITVKKRLSELRIKKY